MRLDDLAETARLAWASHHGLQVDPVAWKAAFRAGYAAVIMRQEAEATTTRNACNDLLVEIAALDPSVKSTLAAVADRGREIEVD